MPKKPATNHHELSRAAITTRPRRVRKAWLASVVALALLGASWNAQALALGAISVQSALGEPLRAEIEIPEMSSEQAASLQAGIASRKEFQAAGVDYSAALSGAQVSLQHRSNGQPYLRVLGTQAVNEPFINLVVNANWTDGHLRRDYTVLVNPPGRAALPAVTANAAETAPQRAASAETAAPRPAPLPPVRRAPAEAAAPKTPPRPRSVVAPEHAVAETAPRHVTVRRGDTAIGIVRSTGLRGVSLDQMLIALLHSNPKAFIDGNVNLVKAGAVVRLPTTQQARATSPTEARKMVIAQTQDFHAYRQRVAQGSQAKAPAEASAAHEAAGAVQSAQVNDQKAQEQAPDHLTVSKASAKDATVTQVAQAREETAQSDRVAELSKNIQELSRLESAAKTETKASGSDKATAEAAVNADAKTAAGTSAGAKSEAAPANPGEKASPAAQSPGQSAPEAATAAPSSAAAKGDQQVASAASAKAAELGSNSPAIKMKADPPPTPAAQPAWYDSLTDNPNTLGLGAALVVLLAGFGLYSARRRRKIQAAAFADAGSDFDDEDRHDGPSGAAPMIANKPKDEPAAEVKAAAEKAVAVAAGAAALKAASNTVQSEPAASALDPNIDIGDDDDWNASASTYDHGAELADFQPTAPAPRMPVLESDPIGNQNAVETPDHALPSLDFPTTEVQFAPPTAPSPAPGGKYETADDKGMIDFDLGPLPDHEEPETSATAVDSPAQSADDPLVTKLSLAQEFSNIGDDEGARSLAQEVVAQATGELRKRAEDFLAHL